jgi:hypothetical protein
VSCHTSRMPSHTVPTGLATRSPYRRRDSGLQQARQEQVTALNGAAFDYTCHQLPDSADLGAIPSHTHALGMGSP